MSNPSTTTGFPAEALDFLADLSENNNREWFQENKKRYQNDLMASAVDLVVAIGTRLQAHFPDITYDTAINGSGSLMRIYRDTRFSEDKTPYKERIAMGFPIGGGKKMQTPSFGMQISATEAGLMAGIFGFDKTQLKQYRDAVVDDIQGWALVEAINKVQENGNYEISGTHYKRTPRGYDMPDDERGDYLLYNGLWASYPAIARDDIVSDQFVDTVIEHYINMTPLNQWLVGILS